jgi:hypothetical protein
MCRRLQGDCTQNSLSNDRRHSIGLHRSTVERYHNRFRSGTVSSLSLLLSRIHSSTPFRVTSGSNLPAVHRWWADVKAWFTEDGDKAAIVADIHHGEIHLIQQYEDALSEHELLTETVTQVLLEQLKIIREQDAAVYDL